MMMNEKVFSSSAIPESPMLFAILLLVVVGSWLSLCSAQDDQEQACPANETYRACASACEPQCGDPPEKVCKMMCMSGECQCLEGYARNASGQCVALADCPHKCFGENEVYRECGSCEPSCAEQNPICTEECRPPACQCAPGYVRNHPKGQCVLPSECPPRHQSSISTCLCAIGYQCVVNEGGHAMCVPGPGTGSP